MKQPYDKKLDALYSYLKNKDDLTFEEYMAVINKIKSLK